MVDRAFPVTASTHSPTDTQLLCDVASTYWVGNRSFKKLNYWLKSEAELGFNPNLLVCNPWIFSHYPHSVIKGHVHKLAHAPNLKSYIISNCPKYALNTGPVPLGEKKSQWGCAFGMMWTIYLVEPLRLSTLSWYPGSKPSIYLSHIKPLFF